MRAWPLLLVLLAGCGCVSMPSHGELRSTAHRLIITAPNGFKVCGGTAISNREIKTAKHCVAGAQLALVDDAPAGALSIRYEGEDVAIVTFKTLRFKQWARAGSAPKQGDRLRWWGNPMGLRDIYREARVLRVTQHEVLMDASTCPGDSGSGLFNDLGELVGVAVAITPPVASNCNFTLGQM